MKAPIPVYRRRATPLHVARAGVAAEVVPPDGLNDFIRRQAAQLLDAAENCRLPELRAEWNRRRAPPSPNWTA